MSSFRDIVPTALGLYPQSPEAEPEEVCNHAGSCVRCGGPLCLLHNNYFPGHLDLATCERDTLDGLTCSYCAQVGTGTND